ncbi:cobalt ECF transporter T component CbiQ [Conexibacter sp. SYSU D00693]|uniref:cobalt ECF transporter T component CbiQ n=1 Tax=Conexibacter sp. SYSU D00693 TaxID=2812560 RepID=UPI00196A7D4D|nr:cobalt ECF transporter T component CbiQ [Conexibacter sp. SYSU D00693]
MTVAHLAEAEPVETVVHRLAPEVKVAATVLLVVCAALVPHGVFWPFAVDAALLGAVALLARVEAMFLLRRLVIEVPFVLFVVALPFFAEDRHEGLLAAGGILCKATLAVLATGVLAATTTAPEILAGLDRLRAPRQLTAIAAFAIRYLQVVLEELRRMQLARVARGDDPRFLWQARAIGQTAGTLAVRCFERGERVHGAMLARGFDGSLPVSSLSPRAPLAAWVAVLPLPLVAALATVLARGAA